LPPAGRETLFEEELSEEQVGKELMPLTVQLAYVLGRQGRVPEAQELYEKVCGLCLSHACTAVYERQVGCKPACCSLSGNTQVAAMNVGDDPVHAPTKAVASNNQFAESGRIDSNPAHKKTVQGAAKKLEGLLADSSKVGAMLAPASVDINMYSACPACEAQLTEPSMTSILAYLVDPPGFAAWVNDHGPCT
jgi:hypothetical protein